MNRREAAKYLTLAGAAVAAMAGDWRIAAAASLDGPVDQSPNPLTDDAAPFCAVIEDARYADTRRFAEALAGHDIARPPSGRGIARTRTGHGAARASTGRGIARLATAGEAITLWRAECRPRLPAHAWRVAGMTTYSDFALLRACARESGGRVVYEGLHDFRQPDHIAHSVRAGESTAALASALRQADWTVRLAQALIRMRLGTLEEARHAVRIDGGPRGNAQPGTLVSWVIASPGDRRQG